MFLTVAEFSKRANISKKKIYDDCKTKLKEYVSVKGGTKMIDEEALKIYHSAQEAGRKTTNQQEIKASPAQEAHKETEGNIDTKESPEKKTDDSIIIEELRKIIREKEAEIKDLREQTQEAQKRIDAKDEQIKEDTKRFTETIQAQIILIGTQQEKIKLLEAPQNEKISFFKRIFKKKEKGDS